MHIFLTGEIQTGKTTIIKKFLAQTNLPADGFVTYWEPGVDGSRSLYLSPYSEDLRTVNRYLVMRDVEGKPASREDAVNVFNEHGRRILSESGRRSIIIMDELGFLESKSLLFRQAVMERIQGNTPVLGVIKPVSTGFLDEIRAHKGVVIREVTVENREDSLQWLLEAKLI